MIRSDKQCQAAKKQLVSLRKALAAGAHAKAPEAVIRAARGQTAELAAQIEKEIADYVQLQKTQATEAIHPLRRGAAAEIGRIGH
jgi:hypothetical protein